MIKSKNYLNEYNKNGFVVIKSIIDKNEIKKYEDELERLSKILIKKYKPPYVNLTKDNKVNTAHNLNKIFPRSNFMKVGKIKILNKLLIKIFDERPVLRNLEIFAKPGKTGMRTPYHQDNYYWNIKNKKAINVWISLDKVDKKNGGLLYLAGSHKFGLINHSLSNVPGSSQEIKLSKLKLKKYKTISPKLNPGDCILHNCEVIHGSNKNITNRRRRAIVVSFKAKSSHVDKVKMKNYLKKLNTKISLPKKLA
tara:strand:- start:900 stop:1655 length:756 start_codon:yes stop_codon:yes gene_type:complete